MGGDNEHKYKIIFIGESDVGKSSIMLRFVKDSFDENINSTIGIDFSSKIIQYKGHNIKINIWDTAGQEKYNSIVNNYYKNVDGAIIVFDLNNQPSFDKMHKKWITKFKEECGKDKPFIIVGNKKDLDNTELNKENGEKIAKLYNTSFYQISARDDKSSNIIDLIIKELIEQIYFSLNNRMIEEKYIIDEIDISDDICLDIDKDINLDINNHSDSSSEFEFGKLKCKC